VKDWIQQGFIQQEAVTQRLERIRQFSLKGQNKGLSYVKLNQRCKPHVAYSPLWSKWRKPLREYLSCQN